LSIELILKENMAEYRLAKVATELNRSFQALADLLNQQGFDVMPKPTTKITEDMYQALLREFSADKAAKDEAKLLKSNRDPKPAAVIPVATKPTPAVEVLAKVEPKAPTQEPIPQEKMASKLEELAGPKILGKIDIGKKKTVEAPPAKVETPVKDVVAEPVVVEKPAAPVVEAPAAPVVETPAAPVVKVAAPAPVVETPAAPVVETDVAPVAETLDDDEVEKIDTKFETLSGPKVLGKINLPTVSPTGVKSLAGEARDELREKRKRKRKAAGTEKVAVQERVQIAARTTTPDPNRPAPKAEITKEAVQQKVRNTMGQMGNAGKTRGMKQ
jgi:translation initiation factor IF-2